MPHAPPVEIEIKLRASPAMLEQLRSHPALIGEENTATLISTYFDTSDRRLDSNGITLRIREGGCVREQTLKMTRARRMAIAREEWNVPAKAEIPKPSDFPPRAHKLLVRLLERTPIERVSLTRIERTIRMLRVGGSTIAVAFDTGAIEAGDRSEALNELELELVEGSACDIFQLVLGLPLGPELTWSVHSKAEQCRALTSGQPPAIIRTAPFELAADLDAVSGFQAIGWNCLNHLLANYQLVIASGDPEPLHQCRVAIRRLRAAFKLFADVTENPESDVLRAEFKAAASGLAPARDLHVLLARLTAASRQVGDKDFSDLLGHVAAQRVAATLSAQTMLAAAPFQRLLLQFANWVECGAWLAPRNGADGKELLVAFVIGTLSRKRRKLRRVRGHLAGMGDNARHRVRIEAKELRYAADFFSSLFTGKDTRRKQKRLSRSLAHLQDSLGELNDVAVARTGSSALFSGMDPITAARLEAKLGSVIVTHDSSRRPLIKAAERALAEACDRRRAWWKTIDHAQKLSRPTAA